MKSWIISLGGIVWILFSGVVTYFGFQLVVSMFEFPFYSQTMGFNLVWIYAIVPIGYALMTMYVILLIVKRIKKIIKRQDVEIVDSRLTM